MIKTCRVCRAGALLTIEAIVGRLDAGAQRLDASAGLQTFLAAGYVSEDLRRLSAHLRGLCRFCGDAERRAGRKLRRAEWLAHACADRRHGQGPGCPFCLPAPAAPPEPADDPVSHPRG